jgi:hypothetical protein
MASYYGGQTVREGFYLNRSRPDFECIAGSGGILPGDKSTCYLRLPLVASMVAGPLMGLMYVILLPIFSCLTFLYFASRWIARRLKFQGHRTAEQGRI